MTNLVAFRQSLDAVRAVSTFMDPRLVGGDWVLEMNRVVDGLALQWDDASPDTICNFQSLEEVLARSHTQALSARFFQIHAPDLITRRRHLEVAMATLAAGRIRRRMDRTT